MPTPRLAPPATRRLLAATMLCLVACSPPAERSEAEDAHSAPSRPEGSPPREPPREAALFREVAAEVGLDVEHVNGMSGARWFWEIVGPGVALFDADGDGDLDAWIVQGRPLRAADGSEPTGEAPSDRLFRNELRETGRLAFTDITEAAGIRETGYGMGVAVGDIDGDGDADVHVSNWDANTLWRNEGDGTFTDVTAAAGVADGRWSTSSTFADFDGDGDLDLLSLAYVDARYENHVDCHAPAGGRDYCGPKTYAPLTDRLYLNRGDGTFEDASARSGIGALPGPGLGVVAADLDGDGDIDAYVANDGAANHLWINRGDATFEERALLAGVALSAEGAAEAGMGVDAADFDDDGDHDLFLSHLINETNTLYESQGGGRFRDRTSSLGLGAPSLPMTGFGTRFLDADLDGRLDLLVVNGAVNVIDAQRRQGLDLPLLQPDQVFLQQPDGTFRDVSATVPALGALRVSRGAAFGDVDDDGDVDVLVADNAGPVRLLLAEPPPGHGWVGLDVRETSGAAAIGAELTVDTGGTVRRRRVHADGSYASSSDPRVVVGLGGDHEPSRVVVTWLDGSREAFGPLAPGRHHRLLRGDGAPAP